VSARLTDNVLATIRGKAHDHELVAFPPLVLDLVDEVQGCRARERDAHALTARPLMSAEGSPAVRPSFDGWRAPSPAGLRTPGEAVESILGELDSAGEGAAPAQARCREPAHVCRRA
jgi:hypothetical protein